MQIDETSLNGGRDVIEPRLLKRVQQQLASIQVSRTQPSAPDLRTAVLFKLRGLGWSDAIQIDPSSAITINGVLDRVGLAVQMGNICRFYADLLKLQTLFRRGRISAALYVVAAKMLGSRMGKNLANYERVVQEVQLFHETITVPLVVLGLEGD